MRLVKTKVPSFLSQNETIGIVAPARPLQKEYRDLIVQWFQERGWRVKFAPNVFNRYNQFAGKDSERRTALQAFLNDPEMRVLWCARGGYGTLRILPSLQWFHFERSPKWIVGYSDITSLLLQVYQSGYCALHAPMIINLPIFIDLPQAMESWDYAFQFLTGHFPEYRFHSVSPYQKGKAKGILIGGNLSTFVNLIGTPFLSKIPFEETILFLEEVDEYLYHVDRMFWQLELSGILARIKGLILGAFLSMKDNTDPFGISIYDIILEKVEKYRYPVVFDLPFGHSYNNLPLLIGGVVEYEVNEEEVWIRFENISN